MELMQRYLTQEQQARLLSVMKQFFAVLLAKRDYAWTRLLIETGMRIEELASMSYRQAVEALASGWLVVPKEHRKGKAKAHMYLVTEPVRQSLVMLLELHDELRPAGGVPADALPPLVWGRCGEVKGVMRCEAMSVRSYQARMKYWAYRAGLPEGVSPHWLRHTRGVNIIRHSRGKNPLKVVQLALGHVSIASSGIYTQMTREEFAREMHTVAGGRMRKADARRLAAGGVR